jgi:hypothetical protein
MGIRFWVGVVVVAALVPAPVDGVGEVVVGGVVVTGFVPTFLSSWSTVFVPVLESLPGSVPLVLSATTGVVFITPIDTSKGTIFVL